jgi:hypothetical protein
MINQNKINEKRREELLIKLNRIIDEVRKHRKLTYEEISLHLYGYTGYSVSEVRKFAKWIPKMFADIKICKGGMESNPIKAMIEQSRQSNQKLIEQNRAKTKARQKKFKESRQQRSQRFLS